MQQSVKVTWNWLKKLSKALNQLRCQPENVVNSIQTWWHGMVFMYGCVCVFFFFDFLIRWTSKVLPEYRLYVTLMLHAVNKQRFKWKNLMTWCRNTPKNKHKWQSHWAKGWSIKKCKDESNFLMEKKIMYTHRETHIHSQKEMQKKNQQGPA